MENIWCGGCWEVLPSFCGCGSVRACSHCASGLLKRPLVEPVPCKADGGNDGVVEEGAGEATMEMVRLELQRMAANVERMGFLGQGVGDISGISGTMGESMVTRDAYNKFFVFGG